MRTKGLAGIRVVQARLEVHCDAADAADATERERVRVLPSIGADPRGWAVSKRSGRARFALVLALALASASGLSGCSGDGASTGNGVLDDALDGVEFPWNDAADATDADATDVREDVAEPDAAEPDAAEPDVTLPPTDKELIEGLPESEAWQFDGLSAPVHVVRTEGNVPHIYAANRADLAYVLGFVQARDRYFMMELGRRLGLGTVSELLGADALATDLETRAFGRRFIALQTAATLPDDLGVVFDRFAEGINEYIARAKAGEVPLPTELGLAAPLLGVVDPTDLMMPFDRESIAAIVAVAQYEASFDTGDVGRTATRALLPTLFTGDAYEAYRRAGAIDEIWTRLAPVFDVASAPNWLAAQGQVSPFPTAPPPLTTNAVQADTNAVHLPAPLLARQMQRLDAFTARFRRDPEEGYGSNAWAVAGSATVDGNTLVSGDGHLSLSVPSFLWQLGLDTAVYGEGDDNDVHMLGLTVPGLPMMGLGTNGDVAWSHTQQSTDITDWYREIIQLDANGAPMASWFEGQWHPLQVFTETIEVADIPLLDSAGGTVEVTRYVTFDGKWITQIEGVEVTQDYVAKAGETVVNLAGDFVVPRDVDWDEKIAAIAFDYTGFDSTGFPAAIDAMGRASTVAELHEAMRGINAYTQNFVAGDAQGNILYSGYQGVPCRGYLARNEDGTFAVGADPRFLLDGTVYGGFEITMESGKVAPGNGSDPYRCAIAQSDYPTETNPPQGFLLNANNDPSGMNFDDDPSTDPLYIGGPFDIGLRADTIDRGLSALVETNTASVEAMSQLQANHDSRLGELFVPYALAAITEARALQEQDPGVLSDSAARLRELYVAEADAIDEIETRWMDWQERGFQAESGVETFYHAPAPEQVDDAVATMLFNATIGAMMRLTFDDEGFPGIWQPGGSDGRIRTLLWMLESRGPDNARALSSWLPETEESVFFDVRGTDEVERSDEMFLQAIHEALAFLRSDPAGGGSGGYGTDEISAYVWGLRHMVRFESILADFLDSSSQYGFIVDLFGIDASKLPLAVDLEDGDPRKNLAWFPRHGDQENVDAGNPGLSGTEFTYASGPVMRMVMSVGPAGFRGVNILPGGQSGLTDSPHFSDQLEAWLGNAAWPMRFTVSEVVQGAIARETYRPAE